MKFHIFLLFLGVHGTSAVMHSWKAFLTGSTGLSEFPEFVAVGLVDDEVMNYFDSRTNRHESRQSWMKENLGQDYDDQQTNVLQGQAQTFKANVKIAMERFNQSKGVHINQRMYGCEWDDETDKVNGYFQDRYDGEDFISFDPETETWTAPKQQAFLTKNKWDNNKAWIAQLKNYFKQECRDWLKKYVNYGRNSLMRKDLPSVSLLQKTPSSPVTCHATGFYPNRADLIWTKDGVEIHDNVDKGETLPNHDGSFQMSVDLKISSIAPEDWEKYDCVFQLSGVKDVNTKLDKSVIRTNWSDEGNILTTVIPIVVVLVLAVIGCIVYKKRKVIAAMCSRSPVGKENEEVKKEMLPQP